MKSIQMDVFTLMVDNEFGVLTRITALIRRAGWNIRSLSVGETAVPEISRLTVCLECRHNTLDSVLDRLGRLNCVREVTVFSAADQVARELILVRVNAAQKQALDELSALYDVRCIGGDGDETVLSVCCEPKHTEAVLERCKALGLRDMARTGTVALKLTSAKEGEQ